MINILKEIAKQIVNGSAEIDGAQVCAVNPPCEEGWYQVSFWVKSDRISKLIKKF